MALSAIKGGGDGMNDKLTRVGVSPAQGCCKGFCRQGTRCGIKLNDCIDVVVVSAQEDGDDNREP